MARTQEWSAADYAANGRFVADLAGEIAGLLNPRAGEHILDAGCGDGALTERLAASGAQMHGVDRSAAMAEAARRRGLAVDVYSLTELPYTGRFDAVFSNAALHWLPLHEQPLALASLYRALRPGGRFVAEMGGQGNIAAIRTALSAVLGARGLVAEETAASFYPAPAHYRALLQQAGFTVEHLELAARPTPLPGGVDGMERWLRTFRSGVLEDLSAVEADAVVKAVCELLRPVLYDSRQQEAPAEAGWTADYVRLRFVARKV